MTCKDDCIHYNVCNYHIDEETPFTTDECNNFKNKAELAEVVRCSECNSYCKENMFCLNRKNSYFEVGKPVFDNHFCSYGEKRVIKENAKNYDC